MNHDEEHAWAKDLLAEYLAGGLSTEDCARIETHADGCDACATELDELGQYDLTLEEVEPEPPTLRERLRSYRPGPAARGLLAGATVVLLGIIGFVITESEPGGLLNRERVLALDDAQALAVTVMARGGATLATESATEVFERKGISLDDGEGLAVHYGGRESLVKTSRREEPLRVAYGGGPAKALVPERDRQDVEAGARHQEEIARAQRKIIRSGEMEFEIESFDNAVAILLKVTLEEKGFVATVNSEKLQNGKVRGTVVVRVPPDHLDTLLLKLRSLGDLKSQRIGSEDVTKAYTDLESRLRAARTMEERLLTLIKEGKGEIKDLIQAEKEIGEWRTRIETMTGEINYYTTMIAMSSLVIGLSEKEIRAPFAVVETERIEMAVEVDDVEKAHREVLGAIAEAKGRVTASDLKQITVEQFLSTIRFEVAPDRTGSLRDRIKQLGIVARLDVNRTQENQGGSGRPPEARVQQNATQIQLSMYNASNLVPRETVRLSLACVDAEKAYRKILERLAKSAARVLTSRLARQKNDETTGTLVCHVRASELDAILAEVRALGEVLKLEAQESADQANTTREKKAFVVNVFGLGSVQPRETSTIALASRDVAASHRALVDALKGAGARILHAELNENDRKNVTSNLNVELRRDQDAWMAEQLEKAAKVYTRSTSNAQDAETVVDTKTLYALRLFDAANVPARETVKLGVEVGDVDAAVKGLEADYRDRVVDTRHTREPSGRRESLLTIDVPLKELRASIERIKALGTLGEQLATKNAGVPDNDLSLARLEVRLSNEVLLASDSGPWANIRRGLAFSLQAASWSLMLIIVGICFVLPLALLSWAVVRIRRKLRPAATPAA